jgi:dimethylargininase
MDTTSKKPRFTRAIVRLPSQSMIHGITTATLGVPDYSRALQQHQNYTAALRKAGLEVVVLEADENFPDSTFIEDVALLTPACAIVMNPGAASRKNETQGLKNILGQFYSAVETIEDPGTVEAGDIMMAGDHFYIGLSERTNRAGAEQTLRILRAYELTGSLESVGTVLHLKTGVSYLENNTVLLCEEFASKPGFQKFKQILVPAEESYAANSVWINGYVLIPEGHPRTTRAVERAGYTPLEINVSEFQKLDGGLSCLSLRF